MIKGLTRAHLKQIWYHKKPSGIPCSPNQFFGWDFFAVSYSKPALAVQIVGNSALDNGVKMSQLQ